jgi:phage shock protein PspC (stress-responsive transcriptional regulator)/two-component sensor histidine kinase
MMDAMTTMREPRRAYREPDDRFLGGVASGVGMHLGIPVLRVRVAFLVLALLGGFGAIVYAGLWLMLPVRDEEQALAAEPPGVSSATRRGFRTLRLPRRRQDVAVMLSLLICCLGAFALFEGLGLGFNTKIFWPILVGSAGLVLLWWQTDEATRSAWLGTSKGWKTWLRTLAGTLLVVGAISLAIFQSGVRGALGTAIATLVLAALGVGLVLGPWLLRLTRALRFERAERIRSQERADVAAHLHDSVLQTLALIQLRAGDAQAVAQLARTQERELRRWLYEPEDRGELMLAKALKDAAAELEDERGMVVEIVIVGDTPVGDRLQPLVAATREALLNAAKHSGVQRVDVYGEVDASGIEIFVRDRGRGFDMDGVPEDRLGVRRSILDRMQRHGGKAAVRSRPGEGTEIRLWMAAAPVPEPRSEAAPPSAESSRGESAHA